MPPSFLPPLPPPYPGDIMPDNELEGGLAVALPPATVISMTSTDAQSPVGNMSEADMSATTSAVVISV